MRRKRPITITTTEFLLKKKKPQEQKKKYKLFDMGKLRVSVDIWETTTLWISTSLSGFAFVRLPNGTNSGHDKT